MNAAKLMILGSMEFHVLRIATNDSIHLNETEAQVKDSPKIFL